MLLSGWEIIMPRYIKSMIFTAYISSVWKHLISAFLLCKYDWSHLHTSSSAQAAFRMMALQPFIGNSILCLLVASCCLRRPSFSVSSSPAWNGCLKCTISVGSVSILHLKYLKGKFCVSAAKKPDWVDFYFQKFNLHHVWQTIWFWCFYSFLDF